MRSEKTNVEKKKCDARQKGCRLFEPVVYPRVSWMMREKTRAET
jgi:hypothetical protein